MNLSLFEVQQVSLKELSISKYNYGVGERFCIRDMQASYCCLYQEKLSAWGLYLLTLQWTDMAVQHSL